MMSEVNEKIRELTVKQSELNADINNIKIEMAEIATNKSSLFDNSDFDKQLILKAIKNNDDMLLEDDEKELDKIKSKIDKLGAINLAAIDEVKEHQERKIYLDKQYEDLTKSIDTLRSAIKKIDVETKAKFKDTFDSINSIYLIFSQKYLEEDVHI